MKRTRTATAPKARPYDLVKVFSTTKANDRAQLGDRVSAWLHEHPGLRVVDKVVRQSSDDAFHCVSIVLFCREEGAS